MVRVRAVSFVAMCSERFGCCVAAAFEIWAKVAAKTAQLSALSAPTGVGPLILCAPSCSLRAWHSCGAWSVYIESLERGTTHTQREGVVALEILGGVCGTKEKINLVVSLA